MQWNVPTVLLAGIFILTGIVTAVSALPPLQEDERVRREFLAAAIGDEIRKNCPSISARMLRFASRATQLQSYALDLGYSEEDISAMRQDPAAREELRRLRDAYLQRNGVVAGQADTYCRLGRQEIEKNTLTGWLLRSN